MLHVLDYDLKLDACELPDLLEREETAFLLNKIVSSSKFCIFLYFSNYFNILKQYTLSITHGNRYIFVPH